MSNPFRWYVYVSVDGGPWRRYAEFPNSWNGQQAAERLAIHRRKLVGIEAKINQERREGGQ